MIIYEHRIINYNVILEDKSKLNLYTTTTMISILNPSVTLKTSRKYMYISKINRATHKAFQYWVLNNILLVKIAYYLSSSVHTKFMLIVLFNLIDTSI